MKSLIKITTICSLLVIACFLISACGGDAENLVQGNGQIDVTVTELATGLPVSNVKIDVSTTGGTFVESFTTTSTGTHTFQENVSSSYTFTFTDLTPARFATKTITNVQPLVTATVPVVAQMTP